MRKKRVQIWHSWLHASENADCLIINNLFIYLSKSCVTRLRVFTHKNAQSIHSMSHSVNTVKPRYSGRSLGWSLIACLLARSTIQKGTASSLATKIWPYKRGGWSRVKSFCLGQEKVAIITGRGSTVHAGASLLRPPFLGIFTLDQPVYTARFRWPHGGRD